MNTLVLIRMAATVAASLLLAFNVHAGGEVKKVCREVKVHKKLEGATKVPPK